MPISKLTQRIATALSDERVSVSEAREIVTAARAEPRFTEAKKAELTALLARATSTFEPGARSTIQQFVDATPIQKELADPSVMSRDLSVVWQPIAGGTLAVDGISYDDIVQGSAGDCYLLSSMSAVAHSNPALIEEAITDNQDGTYSVRFYESDGANGMKPVFITVDSDVAQSNGSREYARARRSDELWPSLIEKAFAQWKGGYDQIGNGGDSGLAMAALTGRAFRRIENQGPAELTFESLKQWAADKEPVVASTHSTGTDVRPFGLVPRHAYTVLGTSEENGVKYVELRNPWGQFEPSGDGNQDGIFKVTLERFKEAFGTLYFPSAKVPTP